MKLFIRIALFISLISCSAHIEPERIHELTPKEIGIANAIEKARVLSQISWIPITALEYNNGMVYQPGVRIQGSPYSSVKETQTYIGHDVSIYTFLTATMNPYSLLYTEKIDLPPYKGTNCRMYYGVVCSSAVMYVLGLQIPYSTKSFIDTDLFVKCEKQSPEDIFLCSVLLQPGHMTMVAGIEREKDDKIVSVDIFDANQTGTSIYRLSYEQFCDRWRTNGLVQYEYKCFENNTSLVNFDSDNEILDKCITLPKLHLCPNKGDKSSYAAAEDVIINILTNEAYDSVELYMSESLVRTDDLISKFGKSITYTDLAPGDYKVRLARGDSYSRWAYFEVLDISTDVNIVGDTIEVKFNSENADAEYVSYNSKSTGAIRLSYNVPESVEGISIPYRADYVENTSVRVIYKGKYGRVFYQYELL